MRRPILLALVLLTAASAQAQDPPTPLPPPTDAPVDTVIAAVDPGTRRDIRLLRLVYDARSPLFGRYLSNVDHVAYPAFAAIPAGLAIGALATKTSYRPAIRAAISEAAAGAFVVLAKNRLRRDRPYIADTTIHARVYGRRVHFIGRRSYSLPSGHSALGFAGATSLALSDGRPVVVGLSLAWATSVAMARVYEGVHYPSDVVAGAAVGFLAGAATHALLPNRRKNDPTAASATQVPLVVWRVPLGR